MDLHMRDFDGTTLGMSVEASSPAFRRMKKNAFTGKIKPRGSWVERTVRCVRAADVAQPTPQAGFTERPSGTMSSEQKDSLPEGYGKILAGYLGGTPSGCQRKKLYKKKNGGYQHER